MGPELVTAPLRQAASLRETAHRPWPVPRRMWAMGQSWHDLLFAHWRVPVEALRAHVPAQFPVDEFDGTAWLGVTPFAVTGVRPAVLPALPRLSSFLEINVRTYVTLDGRPGIYFLSLDASSSLAVQAARRTFRLPYYRARIEAERRAGRVRYESERVDPAGHRAAFRARYEPRGVRRTALPGSLEYFLAERYCLYTLDARGRPLRADIHHAPWPLQDASAELELNRMAPPDLELGGEPLLHFARRQDVLVWPLRPATGR